MAKRIISGRATWRSPGPRDIANLALSLGLILLFGTSSTLAADARRSILPQAFELEQLLWEVELGDHQYTVPRVDGSHLFIGVNDSRLDHPVIRPSGGGIMMCLDRLTGTMIWQLPVPRNMEGNIPPSHFNHWKCGVCSRPAIDGDRLYIVGPRGDVLCLDRDGQADGNDGPFLEDAQYMGVPQNSGYQLAESDGDVVWRFDMLTQLDVIPHDVCGSSPALYEQVLYVCTSNGMDHRHQKMANPLAPSFIALDKNSGRLLGVDGEGISARTFHGQWSSPVVLRLDRRALVLYGGGDGVLYAFEPVDMTQPHGKPASLKVAWKYDCCPQEYRDSPYSQWNRRIETGPSEIIATPQIDKGRVYVAIGQSPLHGPGRGMLSCIDGSTGRKIWESREVDRTLSDVVICDGLLYAADFSARLHCFDADTGELLWQHEMGAGVWCASPVVAGGKVYISNERYEFWVLIAGREKQVVSRSRVRSMAITPVPYEGPAQEGTLYLPTQQRLFALKLR